MTSHASVIGSPRSARSMHQGRGIFHDVAVMNRMARDGIKNHFVGLSEDIDHGTIKKKLLAGGELILDALSLIPAVNGVTTELRAMRWASLFSAPRIMAASELSSAAAMEGFYANAPMLVAESGVGVESLVAESPELLANKALNQVRSVQERVSATSPNAADALARKYRALEGAQNYSARSKTLSNGRIRYYEEEVLARTTGPTRGSSFVTEYNPHTGDVRTWMESYDHLGNVSRVHPKMYNGQTLNAPHYPPTLKDKLEAELISGCRR